LNIATCITAHIQTIENGRRKYGFGEVQQLLIAVDVGANGVTNGVPPEGFFALSVDNPQSSTQWTYMLPVGASAQVLADALNSLPSISGVTVTMLPLVAANLPLKPLYNVPTPVSNIGEGAATTYSIGVLDNSSQGTIFGWLYTIQYPATSSDVSALAVDSHLVHRSSSTSIDSPLIVIAADGNSNAVYGSFATPICSACKAGEFPGNFNSIIVNTSTFSLDIQNISTGIRIYAEVSAITSVGNSNPNLAICDPPTASYCVPDNSYQFATRFSSLNGASLGYRAGTDVYGMLPPLLTPSLPQNVIILVDPVLSSQLLLQYNPPISDGGSAILSYRIEWSPSSSFSGSGTGMFDVPCTSTVSYRVFAVRTINVNVSSDGLDDGTFILALSDGNGPIYHTNPIRWDADASRGFETDLSGSHIYCEKISQDPPSSPLVPCLPRNSSWKPDAPGSMESHIEDLPPFASANGIQVSVTRAQYSSAIGEFIWQISIPIRSSDDIVHDWHLSAVTNSLRNTITGASGTVIVTLLSNGDATEINCTAQQTITGLTQGVPYYARVTAYNSEGFGIPAYATALQTGLSYLAPKKIPGRPSSVTLAVKSGTELICTWGIPLDNGGDVISAYRIDYGTTLDISTGLPAGTLRSITVTYLPDFGPYTRIIGGLIPGTSYYISVSAINSCGTGAQQMATPSNEHPRTVPKAPTSVKIGVTSDTMITVGFTLPIDDGGDTVTAFFVQWDIDPTWSSASQLPSKGTMIIDATLNAYTTITNLAPGGTYYIRVSAGNSVGFGSWTSDTPSGLTTGKRAPGKPYNIQVLTPGGPNSACSAIEVTWLPPVIPAHGMYCSGGGTTSPLLPNSCPLGMGYGTDADGGLAIIGYEIQISTISSFIDVATIFLPIDTYLRGQPVSTVIGPGSMYAPSPPLLSGQAYYVRVAARNSAGTGPFCSQEGLLCDGSPLLVTASFPCN
jgi:Fibronectin type III domain